ncbi:MAG: hypothetical protein R3C40_04360 [Parvularculaceae bacterium]
MPIFIGFESWSSATPNIMKYRVRSQSGSPNSQNALPTVYIPPAAILTEQNPPWAAKLRVPKREAHQPVKDWLWSRPVKNARREGSFFGRRIARTQLLTSPHPIRDFLEFASALLADTQQRFFSRAGEYWFMMPAEPLAHSTPLLIG